MSAPALDCVVARDTRDAPLRWPNNSNFVARSAIALKVNDAIESFNELHPKC